MSTGAAPQHGAEVSGTRPGTPPAVLLVQVPPDDVERLCVTDQSGSLALHAASSADEALTLLGSGLDIDALVIGADVAEPIRLAQRAHAVRRDTAVLLLVEPERAAALARALQFSPFVGDDVALHPRNDEVAQALRAAIDRTRQRRRYRAAMAGIARRLQPAPASPAAPAAPAPVPDARQPLASQYLSRLLDHAPVGVAIVDPLGLVLGWNRFAAAVFGRGEDDVIGRPLLELFPAHQHAPLLDTITRVSAAHAMDAPAPTSQLFEFTPDSASDIRHLEITASPIADAAGNPAAMLILSDVSERLQRERTSGLAAAVGAVLTSAQPLGAKLEACADAMVRSLEAAFAGVWTLNDAGETLELQASAGIHNSRTDGPHARVPVGTCKIGLIAQERRPHLSNDVQHDPHGPDEQWAKRAGMIAFAGYPLVAGERLVGVMGMFARHRLPTSTLDALASIADGVALGIQQTRADAALRTNLNVLRAVTEGTTDAIYLKDAAGRYLLLNAAAARVLGPESTTALGKTAADFLPPHLAAALARHDAEVMTIGETRTYEETVLTEGATRTFLSTKSPYRDERGATIGVIGISRDITERKRTEAAQRFLAEASRTLAASLDYELTLRQLAQLAVPDLADWCVVDVPERDSIRRRRLRRLAVAHIDPAKVQLAYDLNERFPPDPDAPFGPPNVLRTGRSELVREIPASLLEQAARSPEHLAMLRQLGARSYVSVPLKRQDRIFGVITLVSAESGRRFDAADLALAEELAYRAALAAHNAELYHEVTERAEAQLQLNTALREAAEARDSAIADLRQVLRTRDEFLSSAAHDLKTPLAGVKATAQLLVRRAARVAAEDATLAQGLRSIDAAATRMTGLINELLDLARSEMGQPLALDPQPTDLTALVQRAAADQLPIHPDHPIRVELPPTPLIGVWDPARLQRVLDNLLSNAIKYSPQGGDIRVAVSQETGPSGEPLAVMRVTDRGIGIPAADLPHVFERFHRGANTEGRLPGTGIGLASVRTIVEAHGGAISIHSEEHRGTTVTVQLPLTAPDATEDAATTTVRYPH